MTLTDNLTDLKAIAIICIAVIETAALLTGHDGYLLTGAVAAIVGVAGYHIGKNSSE